MDEINQQEVTLPPQSFIIRFFFEPSTTERTAVKWRGQIRHVPSGEYQYFKTLNGIRKFIGPYLKESGVKFDRFYWLRRWWQ